MVNFCADSIFVFILEKELDLAELLADALCEKVHHSQVVKLHTSDQIHGQLKRVNNGKQFVIIFDDLNEFSEIEDVFNSRKLTKVLYICTDSRLRKERPNSEYELVVKPFELKSFTSLIEKFIHRPTVSR